MSIIFKLAVSVMTDEQIETMFKKFREDGGTIYIRQLLEAQTYFQREIIRFDIDDRTNGVIFFYDIHGTEFVLQREDEVSAIDSKNNKVLFFKGTDILPA